MVKTIDSLVLEIHHMGQLHGQLPHELGRAISLVVEPCDLYALAVIHRAHMLNHGLLPLVEQRNILAGAALLRMQLDSGLRFWAVSTLPNAHEIALSVLDGNNLDTIKYPGSKERMRDAYLKKKLNDPRFDRVYEWASDHIHLSKTHVHHVMAAARQDTKGLWSFPLGPSAPTVPESVFIDLLENQLEAGAMIFNAVKNWIALRNAGAGAVVAPSN